MKNSIIPSGLDLTTFSESKAGKVTLLTASTILLILTLNGCAGPQEQSDSTAQGCTVGDNGLYGKEYGDNELLSVSFIYDEISADLLRKIGNGAETDENALRITSFLIAEGFARNKDACLEDILSIIYQLSDSFGLVEIVNLNLFWDNFPKGYQYIQNSPPTRIWGAARDGTGGDPEFYEEGFYNGR